RAGAQRGEHRETVLPRERVVVVAEEEDLLREPSDAVTGGLDEAQLEVARRVLHAVEVAREAAIRREHHDAARVGELAALLIEEVAEPRGAGQGGDRRLVAGEEAPALLGPPAVLADVGLLLRGGELRGLRRVEAHRDRRELASEPEPERLEGGEHAVQDPVAERGTAVVDERQDDGLLPEEPAEGERLPVLVPEDDVEVDRLAEAVLVDPHASVDLASLRRR